MGDNVLTSSLGCRRGHRTRRSTVHIFSNHSTPSNGKRSSPLRCSHGDRRCRQQRATGRPRRSRRARQWRRWPWRAWLAGFFALASGGSGGRRGATARKYSESSTGLTSAPRPSFYTSRGRPPEPSGPRRRVGPPCVPCVVGERMGRPVRHRTVPRCTKLAVEGTNRAQLSQGRRARRRK